MKVIKYISLVLAVVLTVSCEKHTIEYNTTPVADGMAEFQLHYFNPVAALTANNITRVELDGVSLAANSKAPLATYNAIPSGSVGRFYVADAGTVNLKMYQGTTTETLVYDQDVTLTAGKQNVFVHDFNLPPVVFDNGYPYSKNTTEDSDSTCWLKFYHFLYEDATTPCPLRLQYQYKDPVTLQLVNVGQPVLFGQTTGWQPIKIIKSVFNSEGYCRIDYSIKVIDDAGNIVGDLMARKVGTSNTLVVYADYWNGYIGRYYHHVMSGIRTITPGSAVRQFTAL